MENQNTPTPSGTSPEAVRDGLAEIQTRLYEAAENLGGGCLAGELESVARLAADLETRLAAPPALDLSAVSLDVLSAELFRRDCCAVIISPDDLAEYWESDDAGNTHPGSATPTPQEMRAIRRGFRRWLDCGNFTEMMQVCRDYWNDAKQKGGRK